MFTLPIKPTSGRLVFRLLPAGYCALTGVLRLPRTFTVLENAGYAAVLDDSGLQIIPEILDQGVPAMTQSYGIEAQLRAKIWPVLTHPQERFLVRFIEGFPGQNIWTVYAALRYQPKALGVAPSDGHWWRDVAKGGLTAIAPVAGQVGLTVSQLLTQLCVWPGPEGILQDRREGLLAHRAKLCAPLRAGSLEHGPVVHQIPRETREDGRLCRRCPPCTAEAKREQSAKADAAIKAALAAA
jgi:hypothetical protein